MAALLSCQAAQVPGLRGNLCKCGAWRARLQLLQLQDQAPRDSTARRQVCVLAHLARPSSAVPAEQQAAKKYHKRIKVNWWGCTCVLIYIAALIFYIWVRTTKTLGLGKYTW